jgi:hypothetical protein
VLKRTLVSAAIVLVLAIVLVGGYVEHWAWTGYRDQEHHRLRTLWDWLGVSVLPLAVALTPAWLRTRGRLGREWRVAALLTATLLGLLALGGYLLHWTWTGFTGNTLYDWLQLFLVPCALPMAFALSMRRLRRRASMTPTKASRAGRCCGEEKTRLSGAVA